MNRLIALMLFLVSISLSTEVWESKEWINLLYYEKTLLGYESIADGNDFFISTSGKNDPKKEYEESLKLTLINNNDFKTKFPLRYKYITKKNNLKYEPIIKVNKPLSKIILAYPNRYMSNPSSMFGHLYLVLETKNGMLDSDILHFVADTGEASGLGFLTNGLTGQFKGSFLKEPYYKEVKRYTYIEDRDITYYEMILNDEQIENIQLHYIELKNTFFYYKFLDENCAYFIGKFLNVVLDDDIVNKGAIIIPSSIVNNLINKSLLTNETERTASTKIFNKLYTDLNEKQKLQVIELLTKQINNTTEYDTNTLKSFLLISEYILNNYSNLSDVIRSNRIQAYTKLNSSGILAVRPQLVTKDQTKIIRSQSLSLKANQNNLSIIYNPIYFSEYYPNEDNIKSVRTISTQLCFNDSNLKFAKFDLMDLKNIVGYNSILNTYSWEFRSSYIYSNGLLTDQEFSYGIALNTSSTNTIYALIGLNLSNYNILSNTQLDNISLLAHLKTGIIIIVDANSKINISYKNLYQKNYLQGEISYKLRDIITKASFLINESNSSTMISIEYMF